MSIWGEVGIEDVDVLLPMSLWKHVTLAKAPLVSELYFTLLQMKLVY